MKNIVGFLWYVESDECVPRCDSQQLVQYAAEVRIAGDFGQTGMKQRVVGFVRLSELCITS